ISMISSCGIQNLDRLVRRAGDDLLAIGRPRYRVYARLMAAIDVHLPAGGSIPYTHRAVLRAGSNVFAIGRPRYGVHGIAMTAIDGDMLSTKCIPYLDGFIDGT